MFLSMQLFLMQILTKGMSKTGWLALLGIYVMNVIFLDLEISLMLWALALGAAVYGFEFIDRILPGNLIGSPPACFDEFQGEGHHYDHSAHRRRVESGNDKKHGLLGTNNKVKTD
jgi:hypothetical protein